MISVIKYISFYVFCLIFGIFLGIFFMRGKTMILNYFSLEVGQKWQRLKQTDDPFKENTLETYEIIGLKDGYVQYVREKIDTNSTRKVWFLDDDYACLNCE